MAMTKIQIIKMVRDLNPSLGLKEAKDIVDSYEVKSFEDRVARALGEDARGELYTWARLYAVKTGRYRYEEVAEKNYRDWMPETAEGGVNVPSTYICEDDCCRPQS